MLLIRKIMAKPPSRTWVQEKSGNAVLKGLGGIQGKNIWILGNIRLSLCDTLAVI